MTREQLPPDLVDAIVEQLQLMGQEVRLRLIECLSRGQATPGELADELGLTQQNVSDHLQILYRGGALQRSKDGTTVLYSLRDEGPIELLDQMVSWVSRQIAEMSRLAAGSDGDAPAEKDRVDEEADGTSTEGEDEREKA